MSQHTARFVLPETRRAYQSLLERAAQHYRERPEANAVIFVPAGNAPHRPITYRAFFENAARYAETLRGIGIGRHDLAILVMDHSEALLYAFWGALMLGAIPSIFPFLSDRLDPALYFERVRLLISHSGAKVVIASAQSVSYTHLTLPTTPYV
jgi:acyl-CoA synthetase (AMP-forming)/AMP-acid ligase II